MQLTPKWGRIAVLSGAAVSVGALLYYLTKESNVEDTHEKEEEQQEEKLNVSTATQAQVHAVLQKIIESQENMKAVMKPLCAELAARPHSFDEVYNKVKAIQPDDPLESYGLSMKDFDQLLEKFQHEPSIRDAVGKIMGAPGPSGFSNQVVKLTIPEILEIHRIMLAELKKVVADFRKLPNCDSYDMKTVTIAAQAIVGTVVESKFGLNSEEIEAAVILHHQSLSADTEFTRMNIEMQSTMSDLMGSLLSSTFL